MNTAHSQVLSRISKMLLAAIAVAFTWFVLSVAFGFAASDAHADDGGLLDDLGSSVSGAATGVAETVTDTAGVVAQTAAPVVQHIVSAPVVQPAAPVVHAAVEAIPPVIHPVATPIVDGVNGAISTVPVVGDASTALGLDDALAAAGSSVDTILTGTTGAAADTVTGILDPLTGLAPGIAPVTGILSPSLASADTDAAPQPLEAFAHAASLTVTAGWVALTSPVAATSASTDSAATGAAGLGAFTLLRSALQAESALSGPGGAGLGAWVLVALGPVIAYRAWMRRSGPENDVAPAAPAFSTDVSPD